VSAGPRTIETGPSFCNSAAKARGQLRRARPLQANHDGEHVPGVRGDGPAFHPDDAPGREQALQDILVEVVPPTPAEETGPQQEAATGPKDPTGLVLVGDAVPHIQVVQASPVEQDVYRPGAEGKRTNVSAHQARMRVGPARRSHCGEGSVDPDGPEPVVGQSPHLHAQAASQVDGDPRRPEPSVCESLFELRRRAREVPVPVDASPVGVVRRPAQIRPRSQSSRAFWVWRRFPAWSHTTECGPSMTWFEISCPRWAGRQCRTIASGLARSSRDWSIR